ncbi:hypothetical protein HanXRQr2_Chr16g0756291 [Helianthus annuus]|uniref:Uncharacterized protein n=1 Tax=Helianthus annuus TaxID=4232 RepID=A0A9K3DTT3_HELAN|nr:hypothetical protein HanXRQr2_Chr16g0756291 [Helianthus annuus]KAJ0821829.1 hypothetical protein HanPSC8_Chr16g0724771 [Helianthus annuus]
MLQTVGYNVQLSIIIQCCRQELHFGQRTFNGVLIVNHRITK